MLKYLAIILPLLIVSASAEDKPLPTITSQQAQVLISIFNSATLHIQGVDLPVYLDALRALATVAESGKTK